MCHHLSSLRVIRTPKRTLTMAPGTLVLKSVLAHCCEEQLPAGSSWQNSAEGTTVTSLPSIVALSLSHSAWDGNPGSPGRFLHRWLFFAKDGETKTTAREERRTIGRSERMINESV